MKSLSPLMLSSIQPQVIRPTVKASFRNRAWTAPRRNNVRMLTDLADRQKLFESKYADKIQERVKREGAASVEELKARVTQRRALEPLVARPVGFPERIASRKAFTAPVRKDSPPMKPLADIMDLRKILAKNHTPEEVSALWMAYHASRAKGTGRGYLSATISLETYLKMTSLAEKYPSFLVPLPRPPPDPENPHPAHELHFLQWGFYNAPPHPSQTPSPPFEGRPLPPPRSSQPNPACSTVLFTPLQEYKLRQAFAQPQLVLTHYTDLATTHGIVLMRGELTASPLSPEKYLLSQADAQLLAMGVQRFYLATDDRNSVRRAELLREFHEVPANFRWEELVSFADPMS